VPSEWVMALIEALIREHDRVRSTVVWLESKMVAEREARRATEARAEAS
jgi:hypothetical protein